MASTAPPTVSPIMSAKGSTGAPKEVPGFDFGSMVAPKANHPCRGAHFSALFFWNTQFYVGLIGEPVASGSRL